MKQLIINKLMNAIEKNGEYSKENLEVIRYGLESIYISVTKLIVITLIAYLLGILYEFCIFLLIYNIIRAPSFGLHATKSWICLISSSLVFLIMPVVANTISLSLYFKCYIGALALLLVYKNAPADTEKRPIVSKKRRLVYKYISVFIAIGMLIASITISNNFISNSFFWAIIVQCFMISPHVYKLFGLPYNNYLRYQFDTV